jgi:hypothetical protein
MWYSPFERLRKSRVGSSIVVLAIVMSISITAGKAMARVDPMVGGSTATLLDADSLAKVTGGGTVLARPMMPAPVASFGLNARRPVGFIGGGDAEGRINYDRHKNMANRHVNVPVKFMQAAPAPQPPNDTGGDALIVGDCTIQGATCPALTLSGDPVRSVIVYVEDRATPGTGQDFFQIYFCSSPAGFPPSFVPRVAITDCDGPEGDSLRSGNIQIRGDAAVVGETVGTAAGSGAYTSTPNINGVELSGGTFGLALRTAGPSDLEANLNGVQPLLGLFQQLTVTGWVTSASVNGGTMSFSGTASLDMGDGGPPLTSLPLSGSLTASGLTLTVGGWSFGTLPKADGFITIE